MVEPVLQELVDRLSDDAPAAVDLTDPTHEAWAVAAVDLRTPVDPSYPGAGGEAWIFVDEIVVEDDV